MEGIKNFLQLISDNWTTILIILGLIIGMVQKAINYFSKSTDEQISIAKEQIKQVLLKMIADAELNYDDWNKTGKIKRSEVICKIFSQYPILAKAENQQELISWIDREIDNSLATLESIIKKV